MRKTKDICDEFAARLRNSDFVTDKTGVKTIEIMNASFLADDEALFGFVNEDYVKRELDWYLSTSRYVGDIPPPIPEIWKKVASKYGKINSNYGWCIFSHENHAQYDNVLLELARNPDSRRATMIYTRPTMHMDYREDGMSDFICTNTVQYMIREGKVNAIVQMRSNDAVFGYKNDYAWQKFVLDRLSNDLSLPAGNIYWNVASLHVYERHFNLVEDYETP